MTIAYSNKANSWHKHFKLFNSDYAVEFQRNEFRCLIGKVCLRLAGTKKTSQRLVKPCQRDAGIRAPVRVAYQIGASPIQSNVKLCS